MAFKKGEGGRKEGAVNKTTKAAKEIIQGAADALGGQKRMVEWAQEDPANERIFWGSIYPKMLPLDITSGDKPISVTINAPGGGPKP